MSTKIHSRWARTTSTDSYKWERNSGIAPAEYRIIQQHNFAVLFVGLLLVAGIVYFIITHS